ncbi:hypothetical protein M3Y95_01026400 [Aphelenchoides besseyi]|nr:hypothetical protein M3Y95_01026400 [Aphelenchoides besseyi]
MSNLSDFVDSMINIWGQEARFVDRLHFLNEISVYVLSPISIGLLFYMILFRSPSLFHGYRFVLFFANAVDCSLMFSLWFISFFRFDRGYLMYFVRWPNVPAVILWTCFGLYWCCFALESTIFVLEFWFRYVLIKERRPPSSICIFCMCSLVTSSIGITCLFISSYCVRIDNVQLILIYNANIDQWGRLIIQYRRWIIFGSFGLTVLLAILSSRILKRQTVELSGKSQRMLNDYTKICYLKNVAPVVMMFLPIVVRYVTEIYKIESWLNDEVATAFYCWMPFINSTLTLLLIGHYRRVLFKGFKRFSFATNSVHTTVFIVY